MRIELSQDPRDFVARDWTDVARADPVATFFHQPRYLKLYWEEFGHEGDLLLVFDQASSDRQVRFKAYPIQEDEHRPCGNRLPGRLRPSRARTVRR